MYKRQVSQWPRNAAINPWTGDSPPPPPGNDGLKGQLMVLHLDVTLTVCMADRRTNDLRWFLFSYLENLSMLH